MAMRAGGGAAGRKKDFKKVTDLEDARRKREDNIIELRKNKRDENLQKKRQVHAGAGGAPGSGGAGAGGLAMDDAGARTGSQHKVRGLDGGVFGLLSVGRSVAAAVCPRARAGGAASCSLFSLSQSLPLPPAADTDRPTSRSSTTCPRWSAASTAATPTRSSRPRRSSASSCRSVSF